MFGNLNIFSLVLVLICTGLIDSHGLFAQPMWLDRSHDKTFSLEILKPDFEGDDNTTFTTSALFLSGRFEATNNTYVVGEIPFSHFGTESDFSNDESENAIGNPYLGIEIHSENYPVFGEIGLRLPLAPKDDGEDAAFMGCLTDFVDRAEAFIIDAFPISGAVNYFYKDPAGLVLRFRGGSAIWIATGDRDETELFLLYNAQAGYESQGFSFVTGFSGRWLLTEEDLDFGERTFHQLGLAANVTFEKVQPGISFRVPLDEDMTDILDFVFGLTFGINLN